MKEHGEVIYIDKSGARHKGVVKEVVGTGKSGYKTLDLTVAGETFEAVPHGNDEDGNGYWYLAGEKPDLEVAAEEDVKPKKAKKK